MKWLEGWFGTMSGALGAVLVALLALVTPAYTQTQSCMSSDGVTTCSSTYGPGMPPEPVASPQPGALILILVLLLLFIGVLVGTWLDLSGRRTVGRLVLIISVSLLLLAWPFATMLATSGMGMSGGAFATFILPLTLLAFVTGILACVRPDAPRAVVAAAPARAPVSQ